jgi:hypothetical protein
VLLHLRANTTQEIVNPSCKERITSHGDFHPHVRRRQPVESAALARHRYSQGRTEKWNHSRSYRAEYYRALIFYRHPLAFWQSCAIQPGLVRAATQIPPFCSGSDDSGRIVGNSYLITLRRIARNPSGIPGATAQNRASGHPIGASAICPATSSSNRALCVYFFHSSWSSPRARTVCLDT